MKNREEKYDIQIAADHGADGYIVETTKGFYHLKHPDEINFIKQLFLGEKTLCNIYDAYMKKSAEMYGSYYGMAIDVVKDKPLFKLLIELSSAIEKGMSATVKVSGYEHDNISLHKYLECVDATNNDLQYQASLHTLLQEASYNDMLHLPCLGLGNKAAAAIGALLLAAETLPTFKRNARFFPQTFHPIRYIHLAENLITSSGCKALFAGLSESKSLKFLSLRSNSIGDEGLMWIAKALSNPHSRVKELDVIDCDLTDESMHHLMSLLTSNKTLETLRLCGNAITDKGVETILESAKSNPTIKLIDFHKNNVTDGMEQRLEAILADKNNPYSNDIVFAGPAK